MSKQIDIYQHFRNLNYTMEQASEIEEFITKYLCDSLKAGRLASNYLQSADVPAYSDISDDLEAAFIAGVQSVLVEDPVQNSDEETISYTHQSLRNKLTWDDFCNLTGTNYYALSEGFEIKPHEIFEIKVSDVKKYGL